MSDISLNKALDNNRGRTTQKKKRVRMLVKINVLTFCKNLRHLTVLFCPNFLTLF